MTPPPTLAPEQGARIPREIWVLVASAFVIAIGFGLITPVLPQFAGSFGATTTMISVVVSVFAFFRLVFAPAGGRLIARFGERPIYLAGLLIVAASSAATAFAQTYWQLLVYRGLGGIGSTMFTVSAVALIVRLAPVTIRGRVSSAYGSAFLLGGILGPVFGGVLGGFGLRVPFLGYAAFLVLAAALVGVLIHGDALRPQADAPVLPVLRFTDAVRDPAYRSALVSGFANGWQNFGVRNSIFPLFAFAVIGHDPLVRSLARTIGPHLDLKPAVAGLALAIFAVGNAAGLSVAGRWADRRGRRPLILGGLAVSGVATGLTGFAEALPAFVALAVVAGLGAGFLNPAQQASMADVVGKDRNGGPALATFQMVQDAGAIVGPILAGLIVDHGSYALAFAATGVIGLLALVPWARTRETLGRAPVPLRGDAPVAPAG